MTNEEAKTFLINNGYVTDIEEAETYMIKIKENSYAPNMGVSEELYHTLRGD
tara:strand:- start:1277 stop:1432 length:156 start_codon:yes stop_codon:yes gene_type:complete